MKSFYLLLCSYVCFLAGTPDCLAQLGTVNFANGAAGVNAPAAYASGERVQEPDWRAELLYLSGTNFVAISERVPFETNSVAGYFFGGRVSVSATMPGDLATFKVRIWSLGIVAGESEPVQVRLGGDKVPPANLLGLRTVQVAPLVRLSIQKAVNTYVVSWPKNYASFQLQSSPDLLSPWKPETLLKMTNAESVSVELTASTNRRFFRLSSF